jgi:hypothetical protein
MHFFLLFMHWPAICTSFHSCVCMATICLDATKISNKRFSNSYPDNDAVIGNNNKTRVARPSALKNNKLIQNRHELCKVVPSRITDASPTNTRKSKSTPDNKSEVKVKKGLPTDTPRSMRI